MSLSLWLGGFLAFVVLPLTSALAMCRMLVPADQEELGIHKPHYFMVELKANVSRLLSYSVLKSVAPCRHKLFGLLLFLPSSPAKNSGALRSVHIIL